MSREETKENNVQKLQLLLLQSKIPFQTWGTGETKTIRDLAKEVELGEAQLIESAQGLIREINVVAITVLYTDEQGKTWRLIENKQEFHDGRSRTRTLDASVGEKMMAGETPEQTAQRALQEELGLVTPPPARTASEKETQDSQSYPGLPTQITRHRFEISLTSDQYRPDGYTEKQPDKTTYFIWVPAEKV